MGELEVQRSLTHAFIAANPVDLVLIPRERQMTGTGANLVDLPPRPAQTVRIIDQSSTSGPVPGTVVATDGKQRKVEYQLLGEWDATFGLMDYWVDGKGIRWEVAELLPYNNYEQRGQVVRYGQG